MEKIRTSKDLTEEEIMQLVYGGKEEDIDKALKIAEEEIRKGEVIEAEEFFKEMREKYGY